MNDNTIAFLVGLFGSVHCIGMCGPLALAIPSFKTNWWLVLADKLLYNAGRVVSYSLLGLLVGLLGKQLWIAGLQQAVSVVSGMLIIIAGLSRLYKLSIKRHKIANVLFSLVNRALLYALQHRAGNLAVGLLNGFLPCGFVYLALVGAVNTSSPLSATAYMFWFGMGTFPLMLLAMLGSGFIGPHVRRKINKAMPYLMICLGFWFILRGMHLNIAYLSPAEPSTGITICH